MLSDRYVHPEFGLLSPTPRLRRELRMAFFSVLIGIAIGAAAVIALRGNETPSEARVSGVSAASSEQATEAALGNEVKGHEAQVNSENDKPNSTTPCEGANPSCGTTPPHAGRLRVMRKPAANEAVAIGRAPLGRPGAPAEMLSLAPSDSPERALARSAAGSSEEAAADPGNPDRLMDKKPPKSAGSRPRAAKDRGVSRIGRGHYKPTRELDRAYALDRSYDPKGFWDWSR
jgi:hypothetical protein